MRILRFIIDEALLLGKIVLILRVVSSYTIIIEVSFVGIIFTVVLTIIVINPFINLRIVHIKHVIDLFVFNSEIPEIFDIV